LNTQGGTSVIRNHRQRNQGEKAGRGGLSQEARFHVARTRRLSRPFRRNSLAASLERPVT
jgi:hypothetical protein